MRDLTLSEEDQRRRRGYAVLRASRRDGSQHGEDRVRSGGGPRRLGLVACGGRERARAVCAVARPSRPSGAALAGDAQAFREDLGLKEPGLDRVIRTSYELLGLISFLTAARTRPGGPSARARGPTGGGRDPSEIERGFIRAEVVACGTSSGIPAACREQATLRLEAMTDVVAGRRTHHFRSTSDGAGGATCPRARVRWRRQPRCGVTAAPNMPAESSGGGAAGATPPGEDWAREARRRRASGTPEAPGVTRVLLVGDAEADEAIWPVRRRVRLRGEARGGGAGDRHT